MFDNLKYDLNRIMENDSNEKDRQLTTVYPLKCLLSIWFKD